MRGSYSVRFLFKESGGDMKLLEKVKGSVVF